MLVKNKSRLIAVWLNEKLTLTKEIFRQINSLVISLDSKNVGFTKFLS